MKTVRATHQLKTLADQIPIELLSGEADVQSTVEDTPSEIITAVRAVSTGSGKDCVVDFDLGEKHLYFLGTLQEVEAKLKTIGGIS